MAPTLYAAKLESQTDEQWRRRTTLADSPEEAQSIFEDRENTRAAYSITDRKPLRQVMTRRHADGVHARVNLDVFATDEASRSLTGRELLAFVEQDYHVEGDGKVYGPNLNVKSHLQAHYQSEPYKIVELEPVVPNADQLISGLVQLHQGQNEKAWEKTLQQMRDLGIPLNVVTGSLFGLTAQKMIDGSAPIVWSSATIKTSLHTVTYVPNQDTDDFFNDATNEVSASGTYAAGGLTLGSKASTYDTATDQIRLDAADFSATGTTITARRAVVYNDTAGASTTDPVIGWVDFGADVSTTAGTFTIVWDATGIVVYDVT
jgi:hypothetical protein